MFFPNFILLQTSPPAPTSCPYRWANCYCYRGWRLINRLGELSCFYPPRGYDNLFTGWLPQLVPIVSGCHFLHDDSCFARWTNSLRICANRNDEIVRLSSAIDCPIEKLGPVKFSLSCVLMSLGSCNEEQRNTGESTRICKLINLQIN